MITHNVYFPPVAPKTPTISVDPTDANIVSGTRVTLTCLTLSTGTVTYTFWKGVQQLAQSNDRTYTFNSVSTADTGSYKCSATIGTRVSRDSADINLNVIGLFYS